jgi:hypothetical protein
MRRAKKERRWYLGQRLLPRMWRASFSEGLRAFILGTAASGDEPQSLRIVPLSEPGRYKTQDLFFSWSMQPSQSQRPKK